MDLPGRDAACGPARPLQGALSLNLHGGARRVVRVSLRAVATQRPLRQDEALADGREMARLARERLVHEDGERCVGGRVVVEHRGANRHRVVDHHALLRGRAEALSRCFQLTAVPACAQEPPAASSPTTC